MDDRVANAIDDDDNNVDAADDDFNRMSCRV